jgi:hypothetical protein
MKISVSLGTGLWSSPFYVRRIRGGEGGRGTVMQYYDRRIENNMSRHFPNFFAAEPL